MNTDKFNSYFKNMVGDKQKISEQIDEIFLWSNKMQEYNQRVKNEGESPISNHMKQAFGELKHYVSKLDELMPKY